MEGLNEFTSPSPGTFPPSIIISRFGGVFNLAKCCAAKNPKASSKLKYSKRKTNCILITLESIVLRNQRKVGSQS